MNKTQKLFIVIADIILVGIVGGLMIAFSNLTDPVLLTTFILLLVTLLIPIPLALLLKEADSPEAIISFIFFVANIIALSTMFGLSITDHKPLIITETVMGGLYVIIMLIALSAKPKKE